MTIQTSTEINHIAAALLQFQATTTGVVKDSRNPHFKNRYASLEAVIDEARPQLQAVGVAWMQAPGRISGGNIEMTTMLLHAASGQWMSSTMEIPLGKQDPQGAGSAITYAQRYALMATLGLPPVDDDAESAMPRNPAPVRNQVSSGPATLSQLGETFRKTMLLAKNKDELGEWMTANSETMKEKLGEAEAQTLRTLAAARYRELPEAAGRAA